MSKHETRIADKATNPFPKQNGQLSMIGQNDLDGVILTLHGGPFRNYKPGENTVGINLRAEQESPHADMWLPIVDFSVPSQPDEEVADIIFEALRSAHDGYDVYLGCAGGWGRTGLALSLAAKAMGYDNPVPFVRANYSSHAVETEEQQKYVQAFDATPIRRRLVEYIEARKPKLGLWARMVAAFWRLLGRG